LASNARHFSNKRAFLVKSNRAFKKLLLAPICVDDELTILDDAKVRPGVRIHTLSINGICLAMHFYKMIVVL